MKKIIVLLLIVCIISGCNNKNNIQVSELKYEDDYIIGTIKNTINKNYNLDITIQTKSGTLINEEHCYVTIKPYESKELKCLILNLDETYKYEIKKIEKKEFDTPKLEFGEIDEKTLKYYFENIYYNHSRLVYDLKYNLNDEKVKYKQDIIEYKDGIISFTNAFEYENNKILSVSEYSTKNQKLNSIGITIENENKQIEENIIQAISFTSDNATDNIKIYSILQKETEYGKCTFVNNLCYAKYVKDDSILYLAIDEN